MCETLLCISETGNAYKILAGYFGTALGGKYHNYDKVAPQILEIVTCQ
jgi:hypothetical protein